MLGDQRTANGEYRLLRNHPFGRANAIELINEKFSLRTRCAHSISANEWHQKRLEIVRTFEDIWRDSQKD